jgi:RsiW-degrading membrane proteinase PrsW (M82 family)
MTDFFLRLILGFVPVLIFLLALELLDNYRLVRFRAVLEALLAGCVVAVACFFINQGVLTHLRISLPTYARYLAPLVEEPAKAVYLIYLFRRKRIGFLVDAAILGFAVGAGFALIENLTYLNSQAGIHPIHWVIRGFGTAIMHGTTVALIGILAKNLSDRRRKERISFFGPGLGLAIIIHSLFNHLLLRMQLLTSLIFLVGLPPLVMFVYNRSEKSLQKWMDAGFRADVELLDMIRTGTFLKSKMGRYLQSLKDRVPGELLADLICYLRIFAELSIRAKGILLQAEAGFPISPDPEIQEKFQELKYLERNIGRLGKRIISPLLHTSTRELWELHRLKERA